MVDIQRRHFLKGLACAAAGSCATFEGLRQAIAATPTARKMRYYLSTGSIGIKVGLQEAIALAVRYGFEAVEARRDVLASLNDSQLQALLADMKAKGITWGVAGLPVRIRSAQAAFDTAMGTLPQYAQTLQKAGVTRVTTAITPCDNELTYMQNFRLHATRLRQIGKVFADYNLRLGLEYVGTMTVRNSQRFPFLHTMAEMKELLAEAGTSNVGFVLDSWHWWTAGESAADILTLRGDQVIMADINDAPVGIPKEQQLDNQRELPGATGVIDIAAFINALTKIGFDGPVRAEPFNKALNDLDDDAACAATIAALKKVFALAAEKYA